MKYPNKSIFTIYFFVIVVYMKLRGKVYIVFLLCLIVFSGLYCECEKYYNFSKAVEGMENKKKESMDKKREGMDKKREGMDKKREGMDKKREGMDKKREGMDNPIPRNEIPEGDEHLYVLKSSIVPPVCPVCPVIKEEKKCQPCPPCARCPEPQFECKRVPKYGSNAEFQSRLPRPVTSDFSSF